MFGEGPPEKVMLGHGLGAGEGEDDADTWEMP